jgi:uncharacterized protein (TIGR03435 family)
MVACAAAAQTSQFEVASIKPAPPPPNGRMHVSIRGGPGTEDPGTFTCRNCNLFGLVAKAFDLEDYQLTAPDWTNSARFEVSAKIAPGSTTEQFHAMLQNFLAERFQLTTHRAKKEMTVFHLVIAKSGPKFKEYVDRPPPDNPGGPIPRSNDYTMTILNNRAALRTNGGTMADFAMHLADHLRQPVTDATGLQGKYDITLTWIPGEPSADDAGPSIYQALQDQLGLKLESKKASIDIVVVDHAEKTPIAN